MEEISQPDSKEDLKFLVEHFRCLSEGKESVIRQYRELLETYKPEYLEKSKLMNSIYDCKHKIACLYKEIEELKKKIPKPKKKNDKKKDSGRASE